MTENLAAEQKARVVYDNLLRMITDPEVREPLKFLRMLLVGKLVSSWYNYG